jgi:hypothetical protein
MFKVKSVGAKGDPVSAGEDESPKDCLKSPEKKIRSARTESLNVCDTSSFHMNQLSDKIQHFNFKDDIGPSLCDKSEKNCLHIISSIPLHQQILICAICYAFREKTKKQQHETSNSDVELTLKDVQV